VCVKNEGLLRFIVAKEEDERKEKGANVNKRLTFVKMKVEWKGRREEI
jgi:hypothetical protein